VLPDVFQFCGDRNYFFARDFSRIKSEVDHVNNVTRTSEAFRSVCGRANVIAEFPATPAYRAGAKKIAHCLTKKVFRCMTCLELRARSLV
jgi:hypothetical protein